MLNTHKGQNLYDFAESLWFPKFYGKIVRHIVVDFHSQKIKLLLSFFQAVFERLVDIICDKMSESLDSDPSMNTNKVRVDNAPSSNVNCNC